MTHLFGKEKFVRPFCAALITDTQDWHLVFSSAFGLGCCTEGEHAVHEQAGNFTHAAVSGR
jgi:hypothetical protein